MSKRVNRRRFLKQSAAAGAFILVGPGLAKPYGANESLGVAHIALGGQGKAHLDVSRGERCVAICDVDRNAISWALGRKDWLRKAAVYTDYRKLFDEKAKEIDAVIIATPDHNHAPAAARAIVRGIHVFCEKPLTWSVHEARALAYGTRKYKVATQMGNHGHANTANRLIVEFIRSGAIGTVLETHTWTNRPVWPQGFAKRPPPRKPPGHLNWEAWLGPAPYRKFHDGLHRFKWRGWIPFGRGAIGDMGCHTWDCVWWSMAPDAPVSAECIRAEGVNTQTYPNRAMYKWEFPAKGDTPAWTAYWYTGGWKPEVPQELLDDPRLSDRHKNLGDSGNLFVGTKGKLLAKGDYGGTPLLLGEARKTFQRKPGAAIPPSPGHGREWIMACKGEKPWDYPKSNFLYGGPMVEALLLGSVALLAGEKIAWDSKNLRITNSAKANALIRREPYRDGWDLIG